MESYYSTGWQHPQSGAPPQVEITSPAGAWPRNPVWHNPTSDETPRQTSGGRSSGNAYVWSPPISPACIYRESPRLESYASPTSPSWGGHPQAYDGGVVAPQPFYSPSKAIPIRSPNHRAVTSVVTSPISPVSPASPEAFSPIYGRGPPKPSYNWGAHAEGGQIISCNWGEEQMSSQNRSRREQPTSPQMYYSPMLSPQRVSDHGGRAAYFGWDGGVESEGAVVSPRSGVASPRLVEVIKVAEIKPAKVGRADLVSLRMLIFAFTICCTISLGELLASRTCYDVRYLAKCQRKLISTYSVH